MLSQPEEYVHFRNLIGFMHPPKVLFLYSELAGYTVACLNKAVETVSELHVVRWPINSEAPFQFEIHPKISIYGRENYTTEGLIELAAKIRPDVLIISGWMDKGYVRVGRTMRKHIPVVLALDNPWRGDVKQRIATTVGRFPLLQAFSHCWVPGDRQYAFARKLGFSATRIRKGFYSADLDHFNALHDRTFAPKRAQFPKRFLYVGRYVDFKGIEELWRAFTVLKSRQPCDWELWCVGTGEAFDRRVEADGIRHFGFLQPKEMEAIIAQSGVFILPSRKEPWGVVVQEFAAAGFPLICSAEVGAAEMFLQDGVNGFSHKAGDQDSILKALQAVAELSAPRLVEMGDRSHELAQQVSPATWTETLLSFLSK